MKVTPQMPGKWAKAVFMILLGILLLFYGGGFVDDLENAASGEWNMSFEWTWDLLTYLIWILIAWLFVDAVLTIVMSFRMDTYTLGDVMARLEKIERRLGGEKVVPDALVGEDEVLEDLEPDETSYPPPPVE